MLAEFAKLCGRQRAADDAVACLADAARCGNAYVWIFTARDIHVDAPIRPFGLASVIRFGPQVIYPDFLRLRLDLYQFRHGSDLIHVKVSFFSRFI
jgi:hypothetical protein